MDEKTERELDNAVPPAKEQISADDKEVSYWSLFRANWAPTICYCCVYFGMGMGAAFLGPTINDLGCMLSVDEKTMSWLFMCQMFAALFGTLLSGVVASRIMPHIMLLAGTVILPITLALVPLQVHIVPLGFIMASMGFMMGVIDNIVNLLMVERYLEHANPFFQILYFSYGLGALLSPVIAEPFLQNQDCSPLVDNITMWETQTEANRTSTQHLLHSSTPVYEQMLMSAQNGLRIKYAFWIMSGMLIPIPVIMLVFLCCERKNIEKSVAENGQAAEEWSIKKLFVGSMRSGNAELLSSGSSTFCRQCCVTSRCLIVLLVGISAAMGMLFDGYQNGFGGYVYTFGFHSVASLSSTKAAYLNSLFWGTTAVGRLLSLLLSLKLTPSFVLLIDLVGCGAALTYIYVARQHAYALYAGVTILGLFMSSTVPTTLALLGRFLIVTPLSMTVVILCCNIGEMFVPVLVGNLMVDFGPKTLILVGLIVTGCGFVLFAAFMIVGASSPNYADRHSFFCVQKRKSEECLALNKEEFYVYSGDQDVVEEFG